MCKRNYTNDKLNKCKRNYTNDKLNKCKRNYTNLIGLKRFKKNVLKELHECYDLFFGQRASEMALRAPS